MKLLSVTVDLFYGPNVCLKNEQKKTILNKFSKLRHNLAISPHKSAHPHVLDIKIARRRPLTVKFLEKMCHDLGPPYASATQGHVVRNANQIQHAKKIIISRMCSTAD